MSSATFLFYSSSSLNGIFCSPQNAWSYLKKEGWHVDGNIGYLSRNIYDLGVGKSALQKYTIKNTIKFNFKEKNLPEKARK